MSKVVVLLSGGLDSTTLLYGMVATHECYPLTISYGQKHNKEIFAARDVCEARDINLLLRWKYVDLSTIGRQLLSGSALIDRGCIPEGYYTDASMKVTVVPNRNMILLALASGYAQSVGAGLVAYAAHAGDHPIYPDCRPEFIESCAQTMELGSGVRLYAPFQQMTKADIVFQGLQLNVPYRLTWSCYNGMDRPCLRCGTCVERTEAFLKNGGMQDPLLTNSEWAIAMEFLQEVRR